MQWQPRRPSKMRKRPVIRMNEAFAQIEPPHSHARSWHSPISWKHSPRPNNPPRPNPSTGLGTTEDLEVPSAATKPSPGGFQMRQRILPEGIAMKAAGSLLAAGVTAHHVSTSARD